MGQQATSRRRAEEADTGVASIVTLPRERRVRVFGPKTRHENQVRTKPDLNFLAHRNEGSLRRFSANDASLQRS